MKHSTTNVKRSNQLWQKAGTALCFSLSFIWISAAQATPIEKQEANSANPAVHRLSSEELVDLVGPIALFPDDLAMLPDEAQAPPLRLGSGCGELGLGGALRDVLCRGDGPVREAELPRCSAEELALHSGLDLPSVCMRSLLRVYAITPPCVCDHASGCKRSRLLLYARKPPCV